MRTVYGSLVTLAAIGFVLYPTLAVSYSSGAPANFNGSPGSIGACTLCHGSFELNSGDGSVAIEAPATFGPGETLELVVTVDNTTPPVPDGTGQQGFQLSAHDADGNHVGTLTIIDADNTRFSPGDGGPDERFVTHTTAGNQLSSWTMEWTAPTDIEDAVTFYVAGNAGNGGTGPAGDYIYTATHTSELISVESEDAAAPLVARIDAVYPNPVVEAATVAYTLDRARSVTATLYDGLGRTVRVLESGARGEGTHTLRVDAGGLAAGVYFVEVRTPEGRMTRPITVGR